MVAFTPDARAAGRIDGFVGRGFRIGDKASMGGVLVSARGAVDWPPRTLADVTADSLAAVPDGWLLILGTGPAMRRPPPALIAALAKRGVAVEFMDSRAGAKTYNFLLAEGREVVAALLPL